MIRRHFEFKSLAKVVRIIVPIFVSLLLFNTSAKASDECVAQGGSWARAQFGVLCRKDTTLDECRLLGGSMQKEFASDKYICALNISRTAQIAQCPIKGGKWGRFDSNMEYCHFEADRLACLSEKGTWERRGLFALPVCIRPSSDAGKQCTDQSECQFACVAGTQLPLPTPPIERGFCAPNNDSRRWRAVFRQGKIFVLPVE